MPAGFAMFERQVSEQVMRNNVAATPKKLKKIVEDQWTSMPFDQQENYNRIARDTQLAISKIQHLF